nr:MAG TPA: hypothetical protein [Caudoviricetes sp.]
MNFLQTGVPSHAQKPRFKRGINPENMQTSRNLRSFGYFSLKRQVKSDGKGRYKKRRQTSSCRR